MGSTGAGKTYLSKKLSKKYNIKSYELDRIVYDQNNLTKHRTDKEIDKDFNRIINQDNWIIEDIGRKRFVKGRDKADKIYYIKMSKIRLYKQMIKRWINQRKGKEDYNLCPSIRNLVKQLKDINNYKEFEKELLKSFEDYENKVAYLDKEDIKRLQ